VIVRLRVCGSDGRQHGDQGDESALMWEKKVKLGAGVDNADPHAADNSHPWSGICTISAAYCQPSAAAAAACAAGTEGSTLGCAECAAGDGTCDNSGLPTVWEWLLALNASNFAAHADWRLPKLAELESIADRTDGTPPAINVAFHGTGCGAGCTDITSPSCACTHDEGHWTATSYAPDPSNAWLVGFEDGRVGSHERTVKLHVRGVRTAP
jgi:uncharacterized protein DUF1566